MKYEYRTVNVTLTPDTPADKSPSGMKRPATIESSANYMAEQGWRTVGVMPSPGPGYADSILCEREIR